MSASGRTSETYPLLGRGAVGLCGGGRGAGFSDQNGKSAAVAQRPHGTTTAALNARVVVGTANPRRNRGAEVQHHVQRGDGVGIAG